MVFKGVADVKLKSFREVLPYKEHTITLKDYFAFKNPEYVYLRLIPDKTARNNHSDMLGKMVTHMYRTINERCRIVEKQFRIELPVKCAYYIEINKDDVSFVLIVPKQYEGIAKEKVATIWPHTAIEVINGIKPFVKEQTVAYSLQYQKNDALSLSTDLRNSSLINTMLNVIDILDEDDRIGVFYNFVPTVQKYWQHDYTRAIEKYKKNVPLDKNTLNPTYIMHTAFLGVLDIVQDCINSAVEMFSKETKVTIVNELKESLENNATKKLSSSTIKKGSSQVLSTQIAILSSSNTQAQAQGNATSIAQHFHAITEDNSLIYRKVNNPKFNPEDLYLRGFDRMYCSVAETHNFWQLPNRETLEKHKINHISVLEHEIPEELQSGYICLGDAIYKRKRKKAYMSSDKNLANLGLVVLGPQGSGKSKLFGNYSKNAGDNGENLVALDFIKNCELSDEIASVTDPSRLVVIDLSKDSDLQAIGFNEAKHLQSDSVYARLDSAQRQTQCTLHFIQSINTDTEMTSRMRRSFVAACNVVYIHPNTSLRDVVNCLQYHEIRHQYIDMIPQELADELRDDVYNLEDMDDKDSKGNVFGTKANKLDFLMDRINLLLEDRRLKTMFNKPIEQNLDFVELLDQGKTILIKIPESIYPTTFHKNILVTFFISKLWLAAQIRGGMSDNPLRTHIILDEIFQAPTSYGILADILLQARKFQYKFVFSAHFLNKLGPLKEHLKASGSSYMFLQGTDKANFIEMAEDLAPYKVDDLLSLKRYHALCYVRCEEGFSKFIVQLPPPLTN